MDWILVGVLLADALLLFLGGCALRIAWLSYREYKQLAKRK